jgi:hypothetical protein
MTMDTVHVSRLSARYRIPGGDGGARARLDAALRQVLDGALEAALARAGVSAHDEVCIRAVDAPARLRMGEPDDALAAAWSAALAAAIRATIDAGGDAVVRYGSRAQALVDVLVSVSRNAYRRAWAWRQLGLWGASDLPSTQAAADEVARILIVHAELAVAALAAAGRAGALVPLAARIRPDAWAGIARAALRAAAVPGSTVARLVPIAATELEILAGRLARPLRSLDATAGVVSGDDEPSDAFSPSGDYDHFDHFEVIPQRWIDRITRGSAIYPAAVAAGDDARLALAILAALEVEPAALARSSAPALAAAVATAAAEDAAARASSVPAPKPSRPGRGGEADRARDALSLRPPTRREAGRSVERDTSIETAASSDRTSSRGDGRETPRHPSPDDAVDARPRSLAADDARDVVRADASASPDAVVDAGDDDAPAELRRTGETRWGGLLFLLHIVAALGLPREMGIDPVLSARPLRWVMVRLALTLLALDEADPAALAFAGLGPDRDPPTRGEPIETDEESAALRAIAGRITAALHERVRGEPAPDARASGALLREVTRRHAAIDADPGWIDVRLDSDEVDTAVRRAGLDLDPGWVPWLGVVVRFVYE